MANALVAAIISSQFDNVGVLKSMNAWLRGALVGSAYLALIRSKFTTFELHGKTIPAGFELLYDGAKGFVFKRINRITQKARDEETTELANRDNLKALAQRARLRITQDALLSLEDKRDTKGWVLKVYNEGARHPADDFDQRAALADYILSGQHGQ